MTLVLSLLQAPSLHAQTDERCFAETGFCISGPIRAFWERNGGLPVFGLPIGPQQEEQIEGRAVQTQQFERNRLELHPENAAPYDVLIGRLGADRLAQQGRDWYQFPRSEQRPDCRFFPETGHSVCGAILSLWRSRGIEIDGRPGTSEAESLALFGLPLSGQQAETINGVDYTVQWFERARIELHPENAPPYDVLLGLLGVETRAGATPPITAAPPAENPPAPTSPAESPPAPAPPAAPQPATAPPERLEIVWDNPQPLPREDGTAIFPSAVVDSNNVAHVIFASDNGNLWYTNDAAGEFSTPQRIESNLGRNREPFAALALGPDNRLHLAYALTGGDQQVYYRQGRAEGGLVSWSSPQQISEGFKSFGASLAIDAGNTAHIVWIDRRCGVYNVFYRARYADGNLSPVSAPRSDCAFQNRPQIAVTADGTPHVVFQYERDIFYTRLDVGGWSSGDISESTGATSINPTIASDGTAIYTAWDEGVNNHDIFYRRSPDGGRTWAPIDTLSETQDFASFPYAAHSGASGRVYIVWADATRARGRADIWLREVTTANGSVAKAERLIKMRGDSTLPVAAAGPSRVIVVWQDKTGGEWGLYAISGKFVTKE